MKPSMKECVLWNAAGNIIYLAAQWIVTIIVTRATGYVDAGILSIAMSLSATFQTIAMFGIRNFQVSDVNSKYSDTTYVNFRTICCSASLISCMAVALIAQYTIGQCVAILLFMLFRLAESYSDVLHGIAQKNNRLDIAGKAFTVKAIISTGLFFAGYFSTMNLNVGLLLMAISSWLTTLFYDFVVIRKISDFRLFEPIKNSLPLFKEAWPLCTYLFLYSGISTMPKLILEKLCDNVLLGAYSSIFAPALLIQAATGYIYAPFATSFAMLRKDNNKRGFIGLMLKLIFAILLIGLFIFIASIFLGEFALSIIFGETIAEYTYLLTPILIATVCMSIFGFLCMLEVIIRDFWGLIASCLIGFSSVVALSFVFIPYMKADGASLALIISTLVAILIMLIHILIKTRKGDNE